MVKFFFGKLWLDSKWTFLVIRVWRSWKKVRAEGQKTELVLRYIFRASLQEVYCIVICKGKELISRAQDAKKTCTVQRVHLALCPLSTEFNIWLLRTSKNMGWSHQLPFSLQLLSNPGTSEAWNAVFNSSPESSLPIVLCCIHSDF